MILEKPDWIEEIHEMGPNCIEFITRWESTRRPVRRFRLTAGRLVGPDLDTTYTAFLEREAEIRMSGRIIRVWEILDQVPVYSGPTIETCLGRALIHMRPVEVL